MHFPVEAEISSVYLEMKSFLTECALPALSLSRISSGSTVSICQPLNVFCEADDGQCYFEGCTYYPVYSNGTCIGILGAKDIDGEWLFSFHEKMGKEFNNVSPLNEVAVSFSVNGEYTFIRNDISPSDYSRAENDFSLYSFVYTGKRDMPNGVLLSVPVVLQGSDTTGCWAACMSSIGMYHTNQSVSIATIRNITGVAGMNSMQNTCSSMQTIFSLYYSRTLNPGFYRMQYQTAILSQPSFLGCGLILSEEEIAGHMMVLRGYACGTSYNALYLMDPAQGYITVSIVAGSLVSFYYCGYLTAVLEMGDRVY